MGKAGGKIDATLRHEGLEFMSHPEMVIQSCHSRGADELVQRAFKDLLLSDFLERLDA